MKHMKKLKILIGTLLCVVFLSSCATTKANDYRNNNKHKNQKCQKHCHCYDNDNQNHNLYLYKDKKN